MVYSCISVPFWFINFFYDDWVGCGDDRKSTSAYCVFLGEFCLMVYRKEKKLSLIVV